MVHFPPDHPHLLNSSVVLHFMDSLCFPCINRAVSWLQVMGLQDQAMQYVGKVFLGTKKRQAYAKEYNSG